MYKNNKYLFKKIPAYNLQEVLIVLVIIGILLLLALPNLMSLISKTKNVEAQTQLKYIYNSQTTYRYMYSKYASDLSEIDFEPPKTVKENGTANYSYELLASTNNSFKAKTILILPYFIWLCIATSLNMYS